jgi:hypothetical protein
MYSLRPVSECGERGPKRLGEVVMLVSGGQLLANELLGKKVEALSLDVIQ